MSNRNKPVCKFFLQGNCFKGNKCQYSHDTGSNTPSSSGKTDQQIFQDFINANTIDRKQTEISKDLEEHRGFESEIPSAYGLGYPAVVSLINGRDYSPSESRWDYYQARNGNIAQYESQISARKSDMDECIRFVLKDTRKAARYLQLGAQKAKQEPNTTVKPFIEHPVNLQGGLIASSNPFGGSSNAFGATSTSNAFGATSTSNAFGATSTSSAFGAPAFGTNNTSSAFGSTNTSAFGKPDFGSQTNSAALGTGTSAFGSGASAFGSGTSAFGSGASAFGSGTSAFGSGATPATESAFGKPTFGTQNGASAFGSATPATGSAFGQPAFGNSTGSGAFGTSTGSTFGSLNANGASSTTSAFGGSTNSAFGSSAFGSKPATNLSSTTSAFGSSAFGSKNDNPFGSGTSAFGSTAAQPNTFGNNAPSALAGNSGSAFGTNTASPFGGNSATAFGNSTASAFGANSLSAFGNNAASAFGGNNATFGQNGGAHDSNTPAFVQCSNPLPLTQESDLTSQELSQFKADKFDLRMIPDVAPPMTLC